MQIGLWNKITIDAQQQCLAVSWNLNTQFKWNCCGSNLIEFKVLKLDQNQSCTQGIDVDFSDFGIWMWFACSGNQQLYASNRPQTSFYPKKNTPLCVAPCSFHIQDFRQAHEIYAACIIASVNNFSNHHDTESIFCIRIMSTTNNAANYPEIPTNHFDFRFSFSLSHLLSATVWIAEIVWVA